MDSAITVITTTMVRRIDLGIASAFSVTLGGGLCMYYPLRPYRRPRSGRREPNLSVRANKGEGGTILRRALVLLAALAALLVAPAGTAWALTCPTGQVVWIEAYNSSNGTYKQVYWQGGSRYFPGTGTDYVNTGRQSTSFANVDSDSSTKWASPFCVPEGVDLP